MSDSVLAAVLDGELAALRLPGIRRDHPAIARDARGGEWSFEQYLHRLLEVEISGRQERAIATRVREARFPDIKTLDQIDWAALSGVSRTKILELAGCAFAQEAVDVVLAGPVGTGKTHLAIALGLRAAERGHRVLFLRAADLVRDLAEAQSSRALGALQRRLMRADLLILDELGFVPFTRSGGELLFNLLSERHGRRSTLVTTNLAFGEWVQVFGCEKLTTALLDRLCHRAEILVTSGPSYRTRGRLAPTALQAQGEGVP
jgi:DNA replication protein DnaC